MNMFRDIGIHVHSGQLISIGAAVEAIPFPTVNISFNDLYHI
jgi:hypothetical protein